MAHEARRHTAGLFDVRTIIGALLGIYGVVLLLTGLFGGSDTEHNTTSGDSTNVWMGVGLLLVAAFFAIWTWLRPTVVDETELERESTPAAEDAGGSTGSAPGLH